MLDLPVLQVLQALPRPFPALPVLLVDPDQQAHPAQPQPFPDLPDRLVPHPPYPDHPVRLAQLQLYRVHRGLRDLLQLFRDLPDRLAAPVLLDLQVASALLDLLDPPDQLAPRVPLAAQAVKFCLTVAVCLPVTAT